MKDIIDKVKSALEEKRDYGFIKETGIYKDQYSGAGS